MKLRNKKTGKIKDFGNLKVYAETENTDESQLLGNFDSFKQILEYYEDYILPEPLIKDEKVKKLLGEVVELELTVNELSKRFDEFNKHYVELCGEEEEW